MKGLCNVSKKNCDHVNPDLRLCAGKHGNRMSAYREHLANMSLVVLFTEFNEDGAFRTRAVISCQVSDADLRDN